MRRRSTLPLQMALLIGAILLEVAANFASNVGGGSWFVHLMQVIAVPAVMVLLLAIVIGNFVVFRLENPRTRRPRWSQDRAPYPGLTAFTEQDAAVFFGRDRQVSDLVTRLHALNVTAQGRLVVITGASGSGKSSLVHAGLIPRLRARRWTILTPLTPAGEPLRRLAGLTEDSSDRLTQVRLLRTTAGSFAAVVERWRRQSGNRFGRVLIVIDQLEELVTLSGAEERDAFLARVREALEADRRLWVVATLRIEFLPSLLAGDHAAMFAAPFALGSLSRADLVAIVERPAELAGMEFEPGLISQIVEDTGTADALPLLAYLMQELYFAIGSGRMATLEAYRALGGVGGALARQADAIFAELRTLYQAERILSVLLRLVAMEGTEPTRRRQPIAELGSEDLRIVDAFTDARLLTVDAIEDTAYVQVAHEALFRRWPPLRQEVATRAEQLKRRTELDRWAADWLRAGRSPDYLLTGARLTLAAQWLEAIESAGQHTPDGRALVEASRSRDVEFLRRVSESVGQYALSNVETQPELAMLLTAAALDECPVTPLAGRALMAALAHSHTDRILVGHTDAVRAVAWSADGRFVATASRDGTARLWDPDSGTAILVLRGHTNMVEGIAIAPDCAQVATASRDRTVRVWDAATGTAIAELPCGDFARQVAFSPDGTKLAATSRDRLVRVWNTSDWSLAVELAGHDNDVWGVDWSPDNALLATGSHDRTVIMWDVRTGTAVKRLDAFTEFVEAVRWSPDGTQLAVGDGDGIMRIFQIDLHSIRATTQQGPVWSLAWAPDGQQVALAVGDQHRTVRIENLQARAPMDLHGHSDTVWSLALSPDVTRLITGSVDHTARIWTLDASGAEDRLLAGHRQSVTCLSATDDGTITTGSSDLTVRRWKASQAEHAVLTFDDPVNAVAGTSDGACLAVATRAEIIWIVDGDQVRPLPIGSEAESLAWSPDGRQLAAGCKDLGVRILDMRPGMRPTVLTGHTDWIGCVAWSPSGRLLASGADDRTIRIWDLDNPTEPRVLSGHHNYVDGVTWSPDERFLASCSADWSIRIWSVTGELVRKLAGHERRVRAISWSPNGRHLASASDDHTVRIWSPDDNAPGEVIGVHRGPVTCVAWLPDSSHVVTGSVDRTARVWNIDVDTERLIAAARARVFRALSPEERRAHQLPMRR